MSGIELLTVLALGLNLVGLFYLIALLIVLFLDYIDVRRLENRQKED